jgi:trimethylamine:corrinoid methyltransferase-like protein
LKNCRDAKRAASRAEDNVADLLRQAEEVAIDERVREEVDIAKDKAEVRTL